MSNVSVPSASAPRNVTLLIFVMLSHRHVRAIIRMESDLMFAMGVCDVHEFVGVFVVVCMCVVFAGVFV